MMQFDKYIGIAHDHPTFNCWTLVHDILRDEFSILTPEYRYDGRLKDADEMFVTHLEDWIESDKPAPGKMVMFNIGNKPLHCGVMITDDDFIHCLEGRATCIESIRSVQWRDRIRGFYEWQQ